MVLGIFCLHAPQSTRGWRGLALYGFGVLLRTVAMADGPPGPARTHESYRSGFRW